MSSTSAPIREDKADKHSHFITHPCSTRRAGCLTRLLAERSLLEMFNIF